MMYPNKKYFTITEIYKEWDEWNDENKELPKYILARFSQDEKTFHVHCFCKAKREAQYELDDYFTWCKYDVVVLFKKNRTHDYYTIEKVEIKL